MILHPYFVFNGQAKEALVFYAKALGIEHGELKTYGESPCHMNPIKKIGSFIQN